MKQVQTPSLKKNSPPNISFIHPTLEKSHEKNIELMSVVLPQPATGCMTNELEFTSHSSGMRKSKPGATMVSYLHQASSRLQTDEFLCHGRKSGGGTGCSFGKGTSSIHQGFILWPTYLIVSYISHCYDQVFDQKQIKRGSIPSVLWFKRHREGMKAGAAHTVAEWAWIGQANHDIILAARNQLELELETEGIYNPQDSRQCTYSCQLDSISKRP